MISIKTKFKVIIALIIMMIFITFSIKYSNTLRTLEEALALSPGNTMTMIHEEKVDKGSMVFCFNEKEDYLYTSFIRKSLFGYENLYSGVQGDVKFIADTVGLSSACFPAIKNTSLPMYFGIITNPDIKDVKVKETGSSDGWRNAKIIDTGDIRIWLVSMTGFKGTYFDIVGLDKDDKELYQISDTVSWPVEEKPIRSPYK